MLSGYLCYIMSKRAKKTPAPQKGNSSKVKRADLEGSLLFSPEPPQTLSNPVTASSDVVPDTSDANLAYLQRIEETNQSLIRRVSDLESIKSHTSTPQGPQSQSSAVRPAAMQVQPPIYTQPPGPGIVYHNTWLTLVKCAAPPPSGPSI